VQDCRGEEGVVVVAGEGNTGRNATMDKGESHTSLRSIWRLYSILRPLQ